MKTKNCFANQQFNQQFNQPDEHGEELDPEVEELDPEVEELDPEVEDNLVDLARLKATTKLTPAEWETITGRTIIDPDGWDRSNFAEDWAKPLTLDEFTAKADMSTTYAIKGPR